MATDPQTHAETLREPDADCVQAAIAAAIKSPCRSKRGVAVFDRGGLIIAEHNRKPEGFACDGSAECKANCRNEAIHAEQAALLWKTNRWQGAEMLHVKVVDGSLVPSLGPSCVQCSKLLMVSGLRAMWLYHATGWRRYQMHEFHRLSLEAGVQALREKEKNDHGAELAAGGNNTYERQTETASDQMHTGDNEYCDILIAVTCALGTIVEEAELLPQVGGPEAEIIEQAEGHQEELQRVISHILYLTDANEHSCGLAAEACAIAAHQANGRVHPLTCGIDSAHAPLVPFVKDGRIALRCLGPTFGLAPKPCSYVQEWNPLAGNQGATSGIASTAASPALKDHSQSALQARQERRDPGWQSMETAPKDGTPVLGWCVSVGGVNGRPETISWRDAYGGSWWDWNTEYTLNPTHWRPLPEAPHREDVDGDLWRGSGLRGTVSRDGRQSISDQDLPSPPKETT